jgi:signal transduction histidine kinase
VAIDCAAAAGLGAALIYGVAHPETAHAPRLAGVVLAVAAAAAVAVRRLAPRAALAVALAASAAAGYLGLARDPMIALALVLYTVASTTPAATAVAALVLAEAGVMVTWHQPAYVPNLLPRVAATAIVQLAAWTVGVAVATQRRYAAGLREQGARELRAEADRSRRALAEERLRIARELHDVVAHSMGVIAVQAGAGGHVAAARPEEAVRALRAIEATSRAALQELRRMLTVLRDDPAAAEPELVPVPGLHGLPELINRTGQAGLRVELTEAGPPGRLAEGVDVAAFRIVQEALANVVRHAGAEQAAVRLEHSAGGLRITVTDRGAGASADAGEGHGLAGMRERALLCGGEFSAGPLADGGYQVRAFLPAGDERARGAP